MPKFRSKANEPVDLYAPAGAGDSLSVDADQVVEVPGVLAKTLQKKELAATGITEMPEDATLVVMPNGEVRAFPHATWELVESKTEKTKSEPSKESTSSSAADDQSSGRSQPAG